MALYSLLKRVRIRVNKLESDVVLSKWSGHPKERVNLENLIRIVFLSIHY